jgi:uncharacterized protein involved in response to NO
MNKTADRGLWITVSQAPHRLFFATGCIYLLLPILWWTHWLILRNSGTSYSMTATPKDIHLVYMIYGMSMHFILGFAITVFPRWLGTDPIPRLQYVTIFSLLNGGFLVMTVGLFSSHWLIALGSFIISISFIVSSQVLGNVLRMVEHTDTYQPRITWLAISSAGLGSGAFSLYAIFPEFSFLYRITFGVGVYFFVPLVVLSVGYRMVPFFTSTVISEFKIVRLQWVLTTWSLFLALKTFLHVVDYPEGYLVTDAVLLVATLVQFKTWAFNRKRPVMLLTYLYHSMIWFPLSSLFFIADGLWAVVYGVANPLLELAGIHALTIGFFGCMVYSMVTRVSRGHSGRPLMTDLYEDTLYYLLHLSVVSRISFELLGLLDTKWLQYTFVTGVLWLVVFVLWAIRYLPIYFRPRIDGQPG